MPGGEGSSIVAASAAGPGYSGHSDPARTKLPVTRSGGCRATHGLISLHWCGHGGRCFFPRVACSLAKCWCGWGCISHSARVPGTHTHTILEELPACPAGNGANRGQTGNQRSQRGRGLWFHMDSDSVQQFIPKALL